MKKLLLFVSCCLFGICAKAQINLEHTFEGSVTPYGETGTYYYYVEQHSYPSNCYVKEDYDDENTYYKITIYNSDFSLQSEQTYYLPVPPTGYIIYDYYLSQHFFNDDDYYEYLLICQKPNAQNDERLKLLLYDHNHTIIKDFGTAFFLGVSNIAYIINDVRMFLVNRTNVYTSSSSYTDVYSINGVTNSPENIVEMQNVPYPNPANEFINIPIEMNNNINYVKIYDINGRLIETKVVNNTTDNFLLNVTNYPSGIYIYECNGNTNRFIKQ